MPSAFLVMIVTAIYYYRICVWPFNIIQLAFGQNGHCNMDVNIRIFSLVVDIICLLGAVSSGVFAIASSLSFEEIN